MIYKLNIIVETVQIVVLLCLRHIHMQEQQLLHILTNESRNLTANTLHFSVNKGEILNKNISVKKEAIRGDGYAAVNY